MDPVAREQWAAVSVASFMGARTRATGAGLRRCRTAQRFLQELRGVSGKRQELAAAERVAHEALERTRELGCEVLAWGLPNYPEGLRDLHDPPAVLFAQGRLSLLSGPAVAVVGMRAASRYGTRIARWMGSEMGARGVTVVSGLARGVDAAAHEGAVETKGGSIAVLGTGVDVPYPRANQRLARRLRDRGLVLSEFLPGTPAYPAHFPRRNRIVAALSNAVIVVEARKKSGSFITVDHALDLGKPVFGVPGPIDSPRSRGVHELLRQGATLLSDLDSLWLELEGNLSLPLFAPELGVAVSEPEARVGGGATRKVWEGLAEPSGADELAALTRMAPSDISTILTELELMGLIVRGLDGRYARRRVAS